MADRSGNTLALSILCFGFLYAPRLAIGVNLGTAAVAFMLAWRWRDLGAAARSADLRLSVALVLALIAYHLILARFYQNNPLYAIRILSSLPVYLVFGFLFTLSLRSRSATSQVADVIWEVARITMWVTVANSVVVLLQSAFPWIKAESESLLLQEITNIDYASHPFRSRGFSAAGGAALSVMLAVAAWIAAALTLVGRLTALSGVSAMAVLTTANIFVGRTGLVAATGAFALYLFIQMSMGIFARGRSRSQALFVSGLLLVLPSLTLRFVDLNSEVLLWAFEWIGQSGDGFGSSGSTDELRGMLFLPSTAGHLTTGVGFFEGTSLQYGRTDVGYMKTILAFGFPIAGLIYLTICALWLRLMSRHNQLVLLLAPILALLLIVEIKEPFLYQNYAGRFVFLMIGASFALRPFSAAETIPRAASAALRVHGA